VVGCPELAEATRGVVLVGRTRLAAQTAVMSDTPPPRRQRTSKSRAGRGSGRPRRAAGRTGPSGPRRWAWDGASAISARMELPALAASSCDVGGVGYEMATLVTRAGEVLTPSLRAELQAALPA
jgi:predicted phage gp36 major capsid-like protein